MTKREVFLSRTAIQEIERLPGDAPRRIRAKLTVLAEDPFHARAGADVRLLWGQDEPPLYRLRVGDYRVLYFVLEREVRVLSDTGGQIERRSVPVRSSEESRQLQRAPLKDGAVRTRAQKM